MSRSREKEVSRIASGFSKTDSRNRRDGAADESALERSGQLLHRLIGADL